MLSTPFEFQIVLTPKPMHHTESTTLVLSLQKFPRTAVIPAHPHQSNHAIVLIVPRHQHGREKAEDKGEHQSKANPIVLHKDLDTDGALSSQDRWPAWIVDHCTDGPNCPEATKAALNNPDGRQCQATGTFGKFLANRSSKQAPGRGKVRIAAYLLV
jgi:hypothetical protein